MNEKTFRQTLRRAIWIPLGIAIILGVTLILEVRFLMVQTAWVEHSDQVISVSQRIYRNRVDQETGLRAYVLTADKRFLQPFYRGRDEALRIEPELRQLITDNPEQTAKNEESYRAFGAWATWADRAIAMTDAGDDAGDVAFQLRGKKLMDDYRQERTEFIDHERELRDQRVARSRRVLKFVNASIAGLALLFALVLAVLARTQLKSLSRSFRNALNSATEQKDWLHTTLTSIGDAVISTDANGLITLMNPVAEKLTGWTLDEAQGKPLTDVFRIVNQDTRQTVENPVDKVRRLKRVVGLANHTILISKNGKEIGIDDSGAPIFGPDGVITGIVLVFRDVTEQRAAERASARLAAIVEFSGDAILTKTLDSVVQTWNAGAERLFGYNANEIVGKPVTVLIPPDRLNEEDEILQRIRQGRPSERFETVRLAKNGTPIRVSVSASPIKDAEGRVVGASKVIHDISELVAAREALMREKELLATTLASIGDAVIVTDAEGRITFLNTEAERLTAWNTSEAAGRPLPEVFQIINEQTRQIVESPVEKVLRLGGVVGLANHTVLLAKDGREIPIDDSAAPIRVPGGSVLGVVLVFRDFTGRKEAETRLAEQAGLLELTSDAIIVRDMDGRIAYWNRGAQNLYGWSPQEALGKVTHDLLQTKFPQPLPEIVERLRKEKHWQGELVHTGRRGEQLTVLSRWACVQQELDGASPRSVMEINTDITRRKQLEAALQSNERLALAGQLSASIAHEIHNPLDTVGHVLYLLGQRADGHRETQQLLTTAQGEVQRVTEISRNLLSLYRESQSPSAVNLTELMEGVITLIEETISKGRREIELIPAFEGELEAYPSQLRQVFTNVIKNAVEATGEGGQIKVYTEAAEDGNRQGVLVRVVDDGVGISSQMQSRLFNPFVSTKEQSGTGLGLWVSRNIVERHGGHIRLENREREERGTVVSIFLSLRVSSRKANRPEDESLAPQSARGPSEKAQGGQKRY